MIFCSHSGKIISLYFSSVFLNSSINLNENYTFELKGKYEEVIQPTQYLSSNQSFPIEFKINFGVVTSMENLFDADGEFIAIYTRSNTSIRVYYGATKFDENPDRVGYKNRLLTIKPLILAYGI